MLKWIITIVIALFVFSGIQQVLGKLGWGRLPGDFQMRLFGREFQIPLTSTLLVSALFALLAYVL